MISTTEIWLRLGAALGIGLLIGVDRERRKGEGPTRAPAGIRTFALTAMLGAVSFQVGEALLLAVVAVGVAGFAALGYRQRADEDPGLTTEISLLLTLLLGALAMREPALASGLGVTVALLLAARTRIHYFVSKVLTETEVHDALVLAGAALVVLPLMPDRYIGPFDAINPYALWTVVVLMLAISAGGHIALRLLGPRYGLAVAGLISGFVSSAVTIGAMGSRAQQQPALMPAAVAGAVLSTVATMLQMAMVLGASNRATLGAMTIPLIGAGLAAVLYAAWFVLRALRHEAPESVANDSTFNFGTALALAATIAVALLTAAAFNAWLGRAGLMAATAVAGFADAHSPAISVASLAAAGKLEAADAVMPILVAMSTNTVTKIALAVISGGRQFALQVVPGLVLALAAAWIGAAVA